MGIGCRRDPLEANVWYVRAADQGEERATVRIAAIRDAASGKTAPVPTTASPESTKGGLERDTPTKEERDKGRSKRWHIF
jgi:TPR repeat protein